MQRWQVAFARNMTQRFGLHPLANRINPHDRGKAVFTQTPTHPDRYFTRGTQRSPHHHREPLR